LISTHQSIGVWEHDLISLLNFYLMKTRRTFIKQASMLAASAMALPLSASSLEHAAAPAGDYTVLFQGDSITDGNRSRNMDWNHVMGHGYAYLIASRLWFEFPKQGYHFFNRGISGNRVPDLLKRWDTDTVALKPNLLSILIGINDTAAAVNVASSVNTFELDYRTLLQRTKIALPEVQLVLCEPFVLPVGKVKENWAAYTKELSQRQATTKQLATEFNAIFVPFQQAFNDALKKAPADYWIWDGIHPMPAGHELMAREWLKAVHHKIAFIPSKV
jgi:lysophospholipase L1-like esterase